MSDEVHSVTPLHLHPSLRSRGRRVVILMALLVILGLGDLYATIMHLTSIGMDEVNPIGAYLIRANSILGLMLFKFGTMGLTIGLLLKVRHRRITEVASWGLVFVMVALTLHWYQYNMDITRELANTSYSQVPLPMKLTFVDNPATPGASR
ncbi:MAG: hypothetical protein GC162_15995 [Planctomycetes bacterium]|nr:hypothetical protein [Planctomycetota bacterium]